MSQSASVYSLTSDLTADLKPGRRWGFWALILLLVLIIHFLFFMTHVDWGTPKAPPRIDVTQVDPQKLEQIRKHWKEQEQKSFLKSQNQVPADQAPDHARYESDRNIHVEHEQRARKDLTNPIIGESTQKGKASTQHAEAKPEIKAQPRVESKAQSLPKLGSLGLPFHLDKPQPPKQPRQAQKAQEASTAQGAFGGKQYVQDDSLPEGSQDMLNAEESVYYSFYSRVYDAVGRNWYARIQSVGPPPGNRPGVYTTQVDIVLDREGQFVEVRLLQSSGVKAYDDVISAVMNTIKKFPNPPAGLIKEDGNVHMGYSFTIEVGQGTGFNFLPPERTN